MLAAGRFMVLGPDELTTFRHEVPETDTAFPATVMGKVAALGLTIPQVATLDTSVEKREQVGSQQRFDPQGRGAGRSRSVDVTYVVHEELSLFDRAGHGQALVSASLELTADPFAEHPPADDTPELRRAVKSLVAEVLRRALPLLETRAQVNELPFAADWVPWNEERFATGARPALQERLAALDPVSAEAERLIRLSYFEPDLPPDRQTRMLALPTGLLVREVPDGLRATGLRAGDLVTRVESDAVCGPQTFLRWASARRPGSPLAVDVQRGDEIVHLRIPAPDR